MVKDKVTKEILPKRELQKKTKSKFSCQSSCGDNEVANTNLNEMVII